MSYRNFKAEVDYEGGFDICRCDFTGREARCYPVDIKYDGPGGQRIEGYVFNESVCKELESGSRDIEDLLVEMRDG